MWRWAVVAVLLALLVVLAVRYREVPMWRWIVIAVMLALTATVHLMPDGLALAVVALQVLVLAVFVLRDGRPGDWR